MDATAVQEPAIMPSPTGPWSKRRCVQHYSAPPPPWASCPCLPPVLLLPANTATLAAWVNSLAGRW